MSKAPLRRVVRRALRRERGRQFYWSESLECGHRLDECLSDPGDRRLRRATSKRRCVQCAPR